MGIVNVSPESFSGDGVTDVDEAVMQALRFVDEGADILDVGGQSTRPRYSASVEAGRGGTGRALRQAQGERGYEELSVDEELERVLPVIEGIARVCDMPISVDTYKVAVAEAAIEAGASVINDVWGLKKDVALADVAAKHGMPLILMHNQPEPGYTRLIPDIVASLRRSVAIAMEAGVERDRIIVDPGFGFGKTVEHNLEVLGRLGEIKSALGLPLLLGTSRKSTIGRVLDLPVDERVEGTAATVALGIAQGADIVRVHDVKEMVRVARMADATVRLGRHV
ncbi:MAG: dihydropteroate synthase [Dehalococcoidia bacterium]|nr:dihydropteroate synthase [Dehalococcoidia bacterium]